MPTDRPSADAAQAERALPDREERNRLIAENSQELIALIDPDGKVLYASASYSHLLGYAIDQVVDQTFFSFAHPGDAPRINRAVQQSVQSRARQKVEIRLKKVDGDWIEFETIISAITDATGAVKNVLLVGRDITERRLFEQALLKKNQELERAILAKDHFLASMSHELRTPLNAIIGFTGTLLMKLPGPLSEQQTRHLQTVRSSAKHLLSLINDLLDLSKIESGEAALNLEPVVFQAVVEEVSRALRPLAENKGLGLEVSVPGEDLVLNTDRRALTQILLNLASNAVKFTEHGQVQIVLRGSTDDGKHWAHVSVHDTGIGIRSRDQTKLFEAFSQVEGNVRRNEGSGLGLHLSQKLAHLLGGHINFNSEYGKGSTFILALPERSIDFDP